MIKMSWSVFFKYTVHLVVLLVIAILFAIILRVFVFATFKIPSNSMKPALYSGDYIVVNKLILGARVFKDYTNVDDTKRPAFWRVKGLGGIERNDILVFNFPYSKKGKITIDPDIFYVKRCIAIPGDTFYIDNGIYKVKGCTDTLGNIDNQKRMSKTVESDFKSNVYWCFPMSSSYNWNLKFFGPLYVPRKGDCLRIDSLTIQLYKKLIEYETSQKIKIKDSKVYLNDSIIQKYTFRTNYYFMSGDNVLDSRDSRYWGLLPEDHIVGKAAIIWKSEYPKNNTIRWKRVLKLLK